MQSYAGCYHDRFSNRQFAVGVEERPAERGCELLRLLRSCEADGFLLLPPSQQRGIKIVTIVSIVIDLRLTIYSISIPSKTEEWQTSQAFTTPQSVRLVLRYQYPIYPRKTPPNHCYRPITDTKEPPP
jgi:hypothetical protein